MPAFVDAPRKDDERLARRVARRGESEIASREARDAMSCLYARHAPSLLAFLASRVPRDDVEDVHQVVWERVWERLPDCFHEGNFRAWLFQITRNYLIDLRRKKRPQTFADEYAASLIDGRSVEPSVAVIDRERFAVLRQCVARLDPSLALVIQARLAGEDYDAICRRVGITIPQAHKMLHRAKHLLQACVARAL